MADEITILASLAMSKGGTTETLATGTQKFAMSGRRYLKQKQVIGTSYETLQVGELSTRGYLLLINKDPDNFVTVSNLGVLALAILDAGDGFMILKVGADFQAPQLKADTAECEVQSFFLEA